MQRIPNQGSKFQPRELRHAVAKAISLCNGKGSQDKGSMGVKRRRAGEVVKGDGMKGGRLETH